MTEKTLSLNKDQNSQKQDEDIDNLLGKMTGHEFFKAGFERLTPLFSPFNDWIQHQNIKVITIGGTNGKGGTVYFLEALCKHAKLNIASFTSPHIVSTTERIKYNGLNIDENLLFDLINESKKETEDFQLSYYELLFFVFLKYIKCLKNLDYIILEVGLGGRLDAVNQIDSSIAAVVSISRDHTEILGTKLKNILNEKMAIARPHQYFITTIEQQFLRETVAEMTQKNNIKWIDLFATNEINKNDDYQLRNYKLACSIFSLLSQSERLPLNSIPPAKGRGEMMTLGQRSFIFIGAHNVDGIRKMTHHLVTQGSEFELICISFSKRSAKEIRQCLEIIASAPCLSKNIWLIPFNHIKASEKDVIMKILEEFLNSNESYKKRFKFVDDFKILLSKKSEFNKILITGSYYFIGEFQKLLESSR